MAYRQKIIGEIEIQLLEGNHHFNYRFLPAKDRLWN